MGAYLSEPITEKISSEGQNDEFSFGASSMQGWRQSQEDAHNAILDFDKNTSFWAVYDGHGGAEVSAYCALKLPDYLKKLDAYKSGDFEKALKDAFIGFDLTLLDQEVIEELKLLAKKNPELPGDEDDSEAEDENIADLYQEARMPLRQVLEKYREAHATPQALLKLQESEAASKPVPVSPFLRALQKGQGSSSSSSAAAGGSSSSSSSAVHQNGAALTNNSSGSSSSSSGSLSTTSASGSSSSTTARKVGATDDNDATVSSSSSGKCENESTDVSGSDKNQVCNEVPDSSSTTNNKTESVPEVSQSSTHKAAKKDEVVTNGDVVSSETAPASTTTTTPQKQSEGVSSSSSSVVENGEVSSNTNNGGGGISTSNNISSTATPADKLVDSSTDESDEEELDGENSDTEDGEEDPDLDELEEEEEEEEEHLTEEDEEFMNNMVDEPGKDSGCTAVVALIRGNDLYVANAGDSRCVICRNGEAIEMSLDHKPEDQIEFDRIKKAGGRVTLDGRVNGGLNLSRAIGDHGYKTNKDLPPEEQMISALPDIRKLTLTPEDEFMVLACDGIWNFMTSEDVVKFVKTKLKENPQIKLTTICEELFDYCLAPNTMGDGTGCDNMTAIIVRFNKNIPVDCGVASSSSPLTTTNNKTTAQKRTAEENAVPDDSPSSQPSASKRVKVDDDTSTTTQQENELSSSNNVTAAPNADQAPIIDTSSS